MEGLGMTKKNYFYSGLNCSCTNEIEKLKTRIEKYKQNCIQSYTHINAHLHTSRGKKAQMHNHTRLLRADNTHAYLCVVFRLRKN